MNNSLTGFCHSVKVISPYGRNLKAGRRITAERSGAHGPSQLILWWVQVFLSIGWIVFYINAVTKNSAAVFFASVDPFRAVVCRHVPTAAGSILEASLTMSALSSPFFLLFFAFFNFSVTFFLFLSAPHRPL